MSTVKNVCEKVVGQKSSSIGIGDGKVVTKMKKKKKEITFRYVPSEKEYTPQQLEQFKVKEEHLINYIMEQLLYKEAPAN